MEIERCMCDLWRERGVCVTCGDLWRERGVFVTCLSSVSVGLKRVSECEKRKT